MKQDVVSPRIGMALLDLSTECQGHRPKTHKLQYTAAWPNKTRMWKYKAQYSEDGNKQLECQDFTIKTNFLIFHRILISQN